MAKKRVQDVNTAAIMYTMKIMNIMYVISI